VRGDVVRLSLSDGDFIDVKKELNAGEYQALLAGITAPRAIGEKPVVQSVELGMARALAFLVGWSFIGLDDRPLLYSPDVPETLRHDTLKSLDAETFQEIIRALDAHEAGVDAEKKRARSSASAYAMT
jgi:hypothetical protein